MPAADLRKLIDALHASVDGDTSERDIALRVAEFCAEAGYSKTLTPQWVLRHAQLNVAEIVDVGVCHGTPFLYNAFPDCFFLLVDPRKDAEAIVERRPRNSKFLNLALGAAKGEAILNEAGSCSSFLDWDMNDARSTPADRYAVPMTTLDEIIRSELKSDRIGIKIDTEGYEGEILKGLDSEIGRVQFVIAEVSIKNRLRNAPFFSDIVSLMHAKGFSFYNTMRSLWANPQRYCDVLFLRKDDPRFEVKPGPDILSG
ncbi:MAG TPA: FkbM family methyltransferase [Rhizomicrobium sp.]